METKVVLSSLLSAYFTTIFLLMAYGKWGTPEAKRRAFLSASISVLSFSVGILPMLFARFGKPPQDVIILVAVFTLLSVSVRLSPSAMVLYPWLQRFGQASLRVGEMGWRIAPSSILFLTLLVSVTAAVLLVLCVASYVL